jgi:hypothetical protein
MKKKVILGPFGIDSDLRRWGLKLAERSGKNGKKRAVIATARKLAVLLHRLSVSGEAYEPLRTSNQRTMPAAHKNQKRSSRGKAKPKRRVPVTASIAWPGFHPRWEQRSTIRWQHRLK